MSAVVVTVQVLLLVPEFTVTHLLPYLLTIPPWAEVFSGQNQSNGCAVRWVTISRDPESEYPFHRVEQFYRVRAGHLFSPFLKVGRLCDNCFFNHATVFTD